MTRWSRCHPLRRHARAHQMPPVFFVVIERKSGFLERFEIATARAPAADERLENRPSGQQMIADNTIDHDSDPAAVCHLEHEALRRYVVSAGRVERDLYQGEPDTALLQHGRTDQSHGPLGRLVWPPHR